MELSKKTTILLTPDMHGRLAQLARQRRTSIGSLVREAVAECYGLEDEEARAQAVDDLSALGLPVGSVEEMIAESVADADERRP